MKTFQDKVAAITGAGSGIGRALALVLAREGCTVALADIDAIGMDGTAAALRALGGRCSTAVVDVADAARVQAWAADCVREHGRVNLIANNAGVALSAQAADVNREDFEWLMNINFWGVVNGTQAFLPHLRASGDGHVVNISSLFGLIAMPTQSAYNAAKFAVRGYTEALRMELELEGAPVGVTCVHPGGISTNIARAGRIDPRLQAVTGMTPERTRAEADKLLARTTPEAAARQILAGVRRNARRVVIGPDARLLHAIERIAGAAYQSVVMREVRRFRRGAA